LSGDGPYDYPWAARTSIVWHSPRPEEPPIGVCLGCNRIFRQDDEDYDVWKKRRSFSTRSVGGVEVPLDYADKRKLETEGLAALIGPQYQDYTGWQNLPEDAYVDPDPMAWETC